MAITAQPFMTHPMFWFRLLCLLLAVATLVPMMAWSQALTRVPNTTLRLPAESPNSRYRAVDAFPGVRFTHPTGIAVPPGETNRLFVLERAGVIAVVTNLASPNRSVFLDLKPRGIPTDGEAGLLGLAFHPGYSSNGYFYVFYTIASFTSTAGSGSHHRVARFQVSPTDPNRAELSTERSLITQHTEALFHCAGDMHFGPDGYLYIGVGDEGPGSDTTYKNSQRIDKDFFSGILRIDVDLRPGNLEPTVHPALLVPDALPYLVPRDNPWVGATSFAGSAVDPTKVRTEFYAVGLRNPWRMSFDKPTGNLYVGEVGDWYREEVNIIKKGGNYGWAFREGSIPGPRPGIVPASTETVPPIHEYLHGSSGNDYIFNSVIGGVVYHGSRLPELQGHYVFGDYMNGNVWAFRYDGTQARDFRVLTVERAVSAYGVDPRNGDVLLCSLPRDTIKRLELSPPSSGPALPPTLSATGAFKDLATLEPQPGIVPYQINSPFWSDHAQKQRWFSLPNTSLTLTYNKDLPWVAPAGGVWVKHFDLVTNEVTQAKRRLETRFIVQTGEGVYGITYRWEPGASDATLVPAEGFSETIPVQLANGQVRNQQWAYPSRSACLACHTPITGGLLGFNTAQLNRTYLYPSGIETNQIHALLGAGYLSNATVPEPHALPRLAAVTDVDASLEYRVRSYLDSNCSSCHRPGGAAPTVWDARFSNPIDGATWGSRLIDAPLKETLDNPLNRTFVVGHPELSMILKRIAVRGSIQMPPLASSELDQNAVDLLTAWITSNELKSRLSLDSWKTVFFPTAGDPRAASSADPDADGHTNEAEFQIGTDPLDPNDRMRLSIEMEGGKPYLVALQPANRSLVVEFKRSLEAAATWEVLPESNYLPRYPLRSQTLRIPLSDDQPTARFFRIRVQSL